MYITCSCGQRHWGAYGAAGLLLTDPAGTGVVLQERSIHVHQGGTWAVPGGALDAGESAVDAALREAQEEGIDHAAAVTILGTIPGLVHRDWSYTYVLAETQRPALDQLVHRPTWEADQTRWVDIDDVPTLPLHPYFRDAWPELRLMLSRPVQRLAGSPSGTDCRGRVTDITSACLSAPEVHV